MGLFQKCLQLVLQLPPVAPQLVLLARSRPPQTLLGIRHKAQRQFSGHQPLHQAFGIDEISLSSAPPAIGLRLRQMQRSRLTAFSWKDFFTLWKDADTDIPILVSAKSEYAKLQ